MIKTIRGFTIIELVVVIVVVGILAVTVLPRFANKSDFDQAGFRDQVVSVLQFSRKIAIAQRRAVCVAVDASGLTVTVDQDVPETPFSACDAALPLPGSKSGCGANKVCPPSGVALTSSTSSFRFDSLGRALPAGATLTIGGVNVTVEQETGYVH